MHRPRKEQLKINLQNWFASLLMGSDLMCEVEWYDKASLFSNGNKLLSMVKYKFTSLNIKRALLLRTLSSEYLAFPKEYLNAVYVHLHVKLISVNTQLKLYSSLNQCNNRNRSSIYYVVVRFLNKHLIEDVKMCQWNLSS